MLTFGVTTVLYFIKNTSYTKDALCERYCSVFSLIHVSRQKNNLFALLVKLSFCARESTGININEDVFK